MRRFSFAAFALLIGMFLGGDSSSLKAGLGVINSLLDADEVASATISWPSTDDDGYVRGPLILELSNPTSTSIQKLRLSAPIRGTAVVRITGKRTRKVSLDRVLEVGSLGPMTAMVIELKPTSALHPLMRDRILLSSNDSLIPLRHKNPSMLYGVSNRGRYAAYVSIFFLLCLSFSASVFVFDWLKQKKVSGHVERSILVPGPRLAR